MPSDAPDPEDVDPIEAELETIAEIREELEGIDAKADYIRRNTAWRATPEINERLEQLDRMQEQLREDLDTCEKTLNRLKRGDRDVE